MLRRFFARAIALFLISSLVIQRGFADTLQSGGATRAFLSTGIDDNRLGNQAIVGFLLADHRLDHFGSPRVTFRSVLKGAFVTAPVVGAFYPLYSHTVKFWITAPVSARFAFISFLTMTVLPLGVLGSRAGKQARARGIVGKPSARSPAAFFRYVRNNPSQTVEEIAKGLGVSISSVADIERALRNQLSAYGGTALIIATKEPGQRQAQRRFQINPVFEKYPEKLDAIQSVLDQHCYFSIQGNESGLAALRKVAQTVIDALTVILGDLGPPRDRADSQVDRLGIDSFSREYFLSKIAEGPALSDAISHWRPGLLFRNLLREELGSGRISDFLSRIVRRHSIALEQVRETATQFNSESQNQIENSRSREQLADTLARLLEKKLLWAKGLEEEVKDGWIGDLQRQFPDSAAFMTALSGRFAIVFDETARQSLIASQDVPTIRGIVNTLIEGRYSSLHAYTSQLDTPKVETEEKPQPVEVPGPIFFTLRTLGGFPFELLGTMPDGEIFERVPLDLTDDLTRTAVYRELRWSEASALEAASIIIHQKKNKLPVALAMAVSSPEKKVVLCFGLVDSHIADLADFENLSTPRLRIDSLAGSPLENAFVEPNFDATEIYLRSSEIEAPTEGPAGSGLVNKTGVIASILIGLLFFHPGPKSWSSQWNWIAQSLFGARHSSAVPLVRVTITARAA